MVLGIDIETYSSNEIKYGVHKYVDAFDFEILLFAYAFDDEPVEVVDFTAGEQLPPRVVQALGDRSVTKTAFNAAFEITCLKKVFPELIDPADWECTSVLALYNTLPPGLGPTAKALGFPEDKQKDTRGKALIRYFCVPCRPTKANGGRTRNLPEHDREKWATFTEYCRQDVVVERAIRQRLIRENAPSQREHQLWLVDYGINDAGVRIELPLTHNAIQFSTDYAAKLARRLQELTGLENPNSVAQLKGWLEKKQGPVAALDKKAVAELLAGEPDDEVREVLRLRQLLSKTSIKKYQTMLQSACEDGRVHDLFQFYGAARTGRWAGRNVQLQNLPRNSMADLDAARRVVIGGDLGLMEMLYDNIPDSLSQLVRTALVPAEGNRFIVADFSAIEARVIAWMAGEEWRMKVFAEGGDIYCASASAMFSVPVVKHGVNGHLRQKGKVAELALGYQGGPGALIAMGALEMGLTEDELPSIVSKWREASPHIVKFWEAMERQAKIAIRCPERCIPCFPYRVDMVVQNGNLYIILPSGRRLCYREARIGTNRFDRECIEYLGLNQTTRQYMHLETYGGKLVENTVQAVARDCLGEAMIRLSESGYQIVGHIHDEVIIDAPKGKGGLEDAIRIMTENVSWNQGLKLNADGFEAGYYMKD